MKIEDYRLLEALDQYGTIRMTAKKILISQPAVTQRLKYIEDYFNQHIFIRTSKQLLATPPGEMIIAHAKQVLEHERELNDRLDQTREGVAGTLSIGASSLVSQRYLPAILQAYTQAYPHVSIDLVTGVSEEIKIANHPFHIRIIRGDKMERMEARHLFSDALYLFDTQPFEGVVDRPFIEFKSDPDFGSLVEEWFYNQANIRPRTTIKVDQFETGKQFMKKGLGMTVLPESMADSSLREYPHLALEMNNRPLARETWACYQEPFQQLPQVRAFLELIEDQQFFTG
ncbi:LysR family transcriptional regulator [Thalassobacillus sp. CUG 92003]|uniref:LysR family transcriptional regulator n=1 Tax=Thalassobacillus sp. CUG 92003 TaxID=2736641 RepID=UPI0015E7ABDC|nr:LysR family transcriptional regulator [Thalassobacillus sp. CUG 92003]